MYSDYELDLNGELFIAYLDTKDADGKFQPDTDKIKTIIAFDESALKIAEYKDYLVSTDWYYARQTETGEEVPEDVYIKRTKAREFIRSQKDA